MLRATRRRRRNGQKDNERFTLEQVEAALRAADGKKSDAVKRLKCSYNCLIEYLEKYPQLEDVIDELDEEMLDLSESKLKKHIKAGTLDAIKFHLERKGKKRGYVKQQEIAGVSKKPLNISIVPATGPKDEED